MSKIKSIEETESETFEETENVSLEEEEEVEASVVLTDEQFKAIQKAIKKENPKGFFGIIKYKLGILFKAIFELIISIITLKNTGKWISVITIGLVLSAFGNFLVIHNFSLEAMSLVAPLMTQIAIVVFGIIGGIKGAETLIDKVSKSGSLIANLKNIVKK